MTDTTITGRKMTGRQMFEAIRKDHRDLVQVLFTAIEAINNDLERADAGTTYDARVIATENYAAVEVFGLTVWTSDEGFPDAIDVTNLKHVEAFLRHAIIAEAKCVTAAAEILRTTVT